MSIPAISIAEKPNGCSWPAAELMAYGLGRRGSGFVIGGHLACGAARPAIALIRQRRTGLSKFAVWVECCVDPNDLFQALLVLPPRLPSPGTGACRYTRIRVSIGESGVANQLVPMRLPGAAESSRREVSRGYPSARHASDSRSYRPARERPAGSNAGMTWLEIAANAVITVSILLAARNSVHTWWTGVVGCCLFGVLFWQVQLYAEVLLQVFFVATSLYGWWHWTHGLAGHAVPVRRIAMRALLGLGIAAALATLTYGVLLHRFTDAYAPFADSAVLAFSVLAQLLLMRRRIETWPVWLVVNTIAVPLYASRGLELTAILYTAYWLNAWRGWWLWRRALAAA